MAVLVASVISASSEDACAERRSDSTAITMGLPVVGQTIAMSSRVPYSPSRAPNSPSSCLKASVVAEACALGAGPGTELAGADPSPLFAAHPTSAGEQEREQKQERTVPRKPHANNSGGTVPCGQRHKCLVPCCFDIVFFVDLVAACRVFVHVGERGSFTLGAAAARVPQSVASRRIAALERHFGERLFDRSTRRAALTVFGRDMLPSAKRLVHLADALQDNAEQAKLRPLVIAVPDTCTVRQLALLTAAARADATILDFRAAGPSERAELLRSREVRVALIAVPRDEASWVVPLGVASRANVGTGPLRIETLRPRRSQRSFRRIWIQPEDDVPHIRDRMEEISHRTALVPAQITVAASLTSAVSDILRTGNLLLCPATQADELGLYWRPIAGAPVARGFSAAATTREDSQRLRETLWTDVAQCLGAQANPEERP